MILLNVYDEQADTVGVIDTGAPEVQAGVQAEASAARQVGRATAWVLYFSAIAFALSFFFSDPHEGWANSPWPWGRIAVAIAAVAVIAAAVGHARGKPSRPRWAHPIAVRIAVLAVLLAVAGFGVWQSRQADAAAQRQMLAAYTRGQAAVQAGTTRLDHVLALDKPAALTRYTAAPCQPDPRVSSEHCWTSAQAMEELVATVGATLTDSGAQHLQSHCEPAKDICRLRGELFGVSVRMFLRGVAAPSCQCPAAAGEPKTRRCCGFL